VLLALSTSHKLGLAGVAAVFILFALASSFLFPRYRPQYPAGRLGWFTFVALVLFVGMLAAVEIFGAEPPEKAAAEAKSTTTSTAPGGGGQSVQVSEKEFSIALPSTTLKPGSYTFQLSNAGHLPHDLTIDGPQVRKAHTPLIGPGKNATLKVTLAAGTYDFYCSVPGHKQAGMDVKVKVS